MMQVEPNCINVWLKYKEFEWHIGMTSSDVSFAVNPNCKAVARAIIVLPS
jgi:hypothetical protein